MRQTARMGKMTLTDNWAMEAVLLRRMFVLIHWSIALRQFSLMLQVVHWLLALTAQTGGRLVVFQRVHGPLRFGTLGPVTMVATSVM